MVIDDETIKHLLSLVDATENMTRDKLTLQAILESNGIDWHGEYDRLRTDGDFQKQLAITLAGIVESRRWLLQLANAHKNGLPPPPSGKVQ